MTEGYLDEKYPMNDTWSVKIYVKEYPIDC